MSEMQTFIRADRVTPSTYSRELTVISDDLMLTHFYK